MKKYKNRHIRRIVKGIKIAYLTTSILWGLSTCSSNSHRQELKNEYANGEVSKENYIAQSMKFSEKEENLFKAIGIGFGITFVSDVILTMVGGDDE